MIRKVVSQRCQSSRQGTTHIECQIFELLKSIGKTDQNWCSIGAIILTILRFDPNQTVKLFYIVFVFSE